MKAIMIVDENWSIGDGNNCVADIPEDRKFFQRVTLSKPVIMGRKTYESLPKGLLVNRTNIILTHDKGYKIDEKENAPFLIIHSIDEILHKTDEEMYVIGGSKIYNQLLDFCDQIYVTKVYTKAKHMTKHVKNLDESSEWEVGWSSAMRYYNGLKYNFMEYYKSKKRKQHYTVIYDETYYPTVIPY